MRYSITIFSLFITLLLQGQIAFYKQYSNAGSDIGQGVVQLEDSSYVITGSSSSFTDYQSQAFLLKVDSLGVYQWSTHYGGPESEWGRRVLYKKDHGFYICGFTNSYGAGAYDYYLVKTDVNGMPEWEKTYGNDGWERVHDAVLTIDTGIVMVGETNSNETHHLDAYIVRTDKNGDTLWTSTFGGAKDDVAHSIDIYHDSLLIVCGTIHIEAEDVDRGFVRVMHYLTGQTIEFDTLVAGAQNTIRDASLRNDLLDACGGVKVTQNALYDKVYYRYNLNTFDLESPPYFEDNTDESYAYALTHYGNPMQRYVAFSLVADYSFPGGEDLHVSTFTDGYTWLNNAASIAHLEQDEAGQFIATSDGGAMLVGFTSSDGFGATNVFICKIGPGELYPTVEGIEYWYNMVDVTEIETEVPFAVYPNPTSSILNVITPENQMTKVEIFDLSGRLLITDASKGLVQFDLSAFESGSYLLFLTFENQTSTSRKISVVK